MGKAFWNSDRLPKSEKRFKLLYVTCWPTSVKNRPIISVTNNFKYLKAKTSFPVTKQLLQSVFGKIYIYPLFIWVKSVMFSKKIFPKREAEIVTNITSQFYKLIWNDQKGLDWWQNGYKYAVIKILQKQVINVFDISPLHKSCHYSLFTELKIRCIKKPHKNGNQILSQHLTWRSWRCCSVKQWLMSNKATYYTRLPVFMNKRNTRTKKERKVEDTVKDSRIWL